MPKPEQISGAPYPMKVSGVTYRARTLNDRDFDELNAWVRWKFLQETKESIDRMDLTAEDRREMLTSASLASSQVTFSSVEGSRIANKSVDGFIRVGWQMIHHFHPKITLADFEKMFRGKDEEATIALNVREVNEAFIYLNIGIPEEDESEPQEGSDEQPKSDEG